MDKAVHHNAKALQEKIEIDMGKIDLERQILNTEAVMDEPSSLPHELEFPFCRVSPYIGIQVILDNAESATKIHVVDFAIRSGSQWTILMRALADRTNCSLDLLKLTAVGTSSDRLEEVGQRLSSHADSMKLPFSFKVVLSKIEDIKNEHFELESDEVLAVYSSLRLRSLLARPDCLESLVVTIKNLDPCLMVVAEVEADTNTSDFMTRFNESLFLSSAMYDCIDSCVARQSQFVRVGEEDYLKGMIRNVIVDEGEQRIARSARIEFWRGLFGRFGIVETEFSQSCFDQASLLARYESHTSLKLNGKCIVLEWKGTPLFSLSAWKFNGDKSYR